MSASPPDAEPTFLKRWSDRKRDGSLAPETAPEVAADADVESGRTKLREPAAKPDPATPVLTDADMPSLESLSDASDVSAFFNDGVSAALRKAALRRVFSGAAFNRRDGLNDYDGDYTTFEPLGDTVTADMRYQAARRERLARERADAEVLGNEPDTVDAGAAPADADKVAPDEMADEMADDAHDATHDDVLDEMHDDRPAGQGPSDEAFLESSDGEIVRDRYDADASIDPTAPGDDVVDPSPSSLPPA